MKKYLTLWIFVCIGWGISACSSPKSDNSKDRPIIIQEVKDSDELEKLPNFKRIISIGDEITEIVIALGDTNRLIAIDRTHPRFTYLKKPKVGYKATLQTTHLLSHKPDVVLSNWDGSPDTVVKEVMRKKIEYLLLKYEPTLESIKALTIKVSKILKKKEKGQLLVKQMQQEVDSIALIRKKRKDSLRVMYVHARGPQTLLVAGSNTPMDALIRLAGAKNAAYEFEGMESLSLEDMMAINPDFIILTKKGLASLQGRLYEAPVIFSSTAYRLGRVIIYEDYQMLSFGISSPKTALDLCKKLYLGQYIAPLQELVPLDSPTNPTIVKEQVRPEKVEKPKNQEGLEDLKGGN